MQNYFKKTFHLAFPNPSEFIDHWTDRFAFPPFHLANLKIGILSFSQHKNKPLTGGDVKKTQSKTHNTKQILGYTKREPDVNLH